MSTELDQPALGQLRARALDEIACADAAIAAAEARRTYWSELLGTLQPGGHVALGRLGDFKAADAANVQATVIKTAQDAAAQLISALNDEIAFLRKNAAEDRQRIAALDEELAKSLRPGSL